MDEPTPVRPDGAPPFGWCYFPPPPSARDALAELAALTEAEEIELNRQLREAK